MSAITLRPYQQAAIDALYAHLRTRDDNPCIVIPTAGGKTPVMASICRDAVGKWGGRVMILAHVKELLEQSIDKLRVMAPDMLLKIGVYSAGLKSRDTEHPVIVAGIQSVYRRAAELDRFDLIIIDEAHMIPPDGEGMYKTFLADARVVNPNVRIIGLTATPYRMTSGWICAPENILNHVCYEVGVRELIAQGFLCNLKSKAGMARADTKDVHLRGGEFIANELELLMNDDALVRSACREIVEKTKDRKACLIFASGIKHAEHVQATLAELGCECGFVCGETLDFDRGDTLRRFKAGELKYLVNVNVLTTGFDAPNIDCVAMLRPTMSPGLYYQMVGRGFRLNPGKADCLVLDFGGNIMRHGPVDDLRIESREGKGGEAPAKECPQCHSIIHAAYTACPECGFVFPDRAKPKHDRAADARSDILSGEITDTVHVVTDVAYGVHHKRGAEPDAPRTMRVDYIIELGQRVSEWVCFEHTGYARGKAIGWWRERSNWPVPTTSAEAVELASSGAVAAPSEITVRRVSGEKFDRVIAAKLGDKPEHVEAVDVDEDYSEPPDYVPAFNNDEIPF